MDIHIVRAEKYENDSRWNHPINHYPYNTLYFVAGGDGFVKIGDVTTALVPGFVYLIPADTLYSCWCESWINKVYIEVKALLVPGCHIFHRETQIRAMPFSIKETEGLMALILDGGIKSQLCIQALTIQVIADFLPEDFVPNDPEILRFKPFLDYIESNLSATLQVGEIGARFGRNPTVLSRHFKQKFGKPLKAYMQQLMADRLKQELATTGKSLKELAAYYGFCDQYYMSSFFKGQVGVSPSLYRKQTVRRG